MSPTDEPTQGSHGSARPQAEATPPKTPDADMQAEDGGSGAGDSDSATAASRAMKQTSKTVSESQR